MTRSIFFAGAAALLMAPVIAQAQAVTPVSPPADQSAPVDATTPVAPAPADAAPAAALDAGAPVATASAGDGVTKEGGKYLKDGRKATKVEIAEYKKAEKARSQ